MNTPPPGQRFVVVGTSGSGKSTLAAAMSARLGVPHVELDAIRHQAGWVELEDGPMRARVAEAVSGPAWIVDGNYSAVRSVVWPAADTLVWLDLPLGLTLIRLARRTWRRWRTSEELWNGNREKVSNHLRWDGLFFWALRTRGKLRRTYSQVGQTHPHLRLVRLRSPAEVEAWLSALPSLPAP